MEIEKLQVHIDQVRDSIFEAWNEGINGWDEMELFLEEVKSQVMKDYFDVYDNIVWTGTPSEYIDDEEDDDEL